MIEIEPITNKASHERALAEVLRLMRAEPPLGTLDSHRLNILGLVIEDYEAKIAAVDDVENGVREFSPVEAIAERVEQMQMPRAQLAKLLGGESRVTEIMGYQRSLTVGMIRRVSAALTIPAEVLIQEYPLRRKMAETRLPASTIEANKVAVGA